MWALVVNDYVLVEEPSGGIVVHAVGCLEVERARRLGKPIAFLFGCDSPPPPDLPRHSCLRDKQ